MDIKFDITPHVVKQLGEELVSDEITALMELVKNSYDADASYVSIDINTKGTLDEKGLFYPNHKGYIKIEDDGFGMDEDTILKSWLIISFSNKREMKRLKQKTPQGRTPLGEKGLGRLSTQRLASICEIITQKHDTLEYTHIAFDWREFETKDKLSNVSVRHKVCKGERNGTSLYLTDLRNTDVWRGTNLERFKAQILQMISPYSENRPFDVYINIDGENLDLEEESSAVKDLSVAKYSFNFDGKFITIEGDIALNKLIGNNIQDYYRFISSDKGKRFAKYHLDKLSDNTMRYVKDCHFFLHFRKKFDLEEDIPGLDFINKNEHEELMIANPGAFKGILYDFSLDNSLRKTENALSAFDKFSNYKEFVKQQAGVKIYRNGFALRPFGFDSNDWLKLRESQTSASSYYLLRPANVMGYFAIDEGVNYNLKDKTDREGFVSNEYERNFNILAFFIRDKCNEAIERVRRNYLEFLKEVKVENNKITTVKDVYSSIDEKINEAKKSKQKIKRVLLKTEGIRNQSNALLKQMDTPLFPNEVEIKVTTQIKKILNQLAITEETILSFNNIFSEIENFSDIIDVIKPKIEILENQLDDFSELAGLGLISESISHEVATISERLNDQRQLYYNKLTSGKLKDSDSYVLLEYIQSTVNGLRQQLKHIDPTLKYSRDKKELFSISSFFLSQNEFYYERYRKNNIEFNIDIVDDFFVEINKGKLTQVVDNILNNSEYWLKDRKSKELDFNAKINIKIEKPWIYIYDNGYGVTPDIQNNIFEPFVTMKPRNKGRGLGLFIVQQLLDSIGCTINLDSDLNASHRKYIFSINLYSVQREI